MSVERYMNFVSKTNTLAGCGNACKALVECVVECDDIFTIAQVDSNDSSTYKAWLRVYDSDMYLCIYNSSYYFYVSIYHNINGIKLREYSYDNSGFLNKNPNSTTYGATISRVGDFLFTVGLQSSGVTTTIYASFATGVSEYSNEQHWFYSIGTKSDGLGGRLYTDTCLPSSSGHSSSVNVVTGETKNISMLYTSVASSCTTGTGAAGVLNPYAYCGYTLDNLSWLGRIKWGGKYDLYRLYSPSGVYTVDPTADYTIDGETYKGLFTQLIIPVECK